MAENGEERRRHRRLAVDKAAEMRVDGKAYPDALNDISAGGASMKAELVGLDDDEAELAIDGFGEFDAAIVRQWDTGAALEFDLGEDDQYALAEELDAFRRENDLDWD